MKNTHLIKHPKLYIQILLALFYTAAALTAMSYFSSNKVAWSLGIGVLAATIFLVFSFPSAKVATPGNIIFGYIIGLSVGIIVHLVLFSFFPNTVNDKELVRFSLLVSAAIPVGLSIILMGVLKCIHPPAVAASIVLTIGMKGINTVIILLVFAIVLGITKHLLKNYLIDLS